MTNCPHAASMSLPLLRRTVIMTPCCAQLLVNALRRSSKISDSLFPGPGYNIDVDHDRKMAAQTDQIFASSALSL
ncbi:MAG: hypothetical protein IPF46_16100 [Saprospiraceae bacterium]|nr:hypothetical protein [Candidatus Vicinibacter affinis]